MKNLNFLIKPASSLCNMRCRYCFYEDEAVNRAEASTGRMTTETVDCLIQQAFAALDNRNSSVTFAFQGGEPTLAGLDYYRYFVEKVYQHNANHVHVNFAIQTNGLMIDEQWAVFLAANRFLVGISKDHYLKYNRKTNNCPELSSKTIEIPKNSIQKRTDVLVQHDKNEHLFRKALILRMNDRIINPSKRFQGPEFLHW